MLSGSRRRVANSSGQRDLVKRSDLPFQQRQIAELSHLVTRTRFFQDSDTAADTNPNP